MFFFTFLWVELSLNSVMFIIVYWLAHICRALSQLLIMYWGTDARPGAFVSGWIKKLPHVLNPTLCYHLPLEGWWEGCVCAEPALFLGGELWELSSGDGRNSLWRKDFCDKEVLHWVRTRNSTQPGEGALGRRTNGWQERTFGEMQVFLWLEPKYEEPDKGRQQR